MKSEQRTGGAAGLDAARHVGNPQLVAGAHGDNPASTNSTAHAGSYPGNKPEQSWVKYVDSRLKQFGTR
jgi:hypothetical protein